MTWQPLLEGALKDRAWEGVNAIVDHLAPREWGPHDDPSLAQGSAGAAVLHAYLAQTGVEQISSSARSKGTTWPWSRRVTDGLEIRPTERGQRPAAIACGCLTHSLATIQNKAVPASLYGGLAGVGWALSHLGGRLLDLDSAESCGEIDEVLLDYLDQWPRSATFDLADGLVGFGVYALERLKKGTVPPHAACACLERVIDRLAETAEHRSDGITWASSPNWLAPEYRALRPRPYYDLGLPYGVPGVIALLARACAAGVAVSRAQPLLEGAVRWLMNQHVVDARAGVPCHLGSGLVPVPAAPGYWYGDPGVAAALLGAAHAVAEASWERAARAVARRAAAYPLERAGVVQAGLYQGAAGLGHLFNRLFQATGDACLGQAARFWFRRTLDMRSPRGEAAGCIAWGPGPKGTPVTWIDDTGLISGTTGIALALLAAVTSTEPEWDRVLLVSLAPHSASGQGASATGRKARACLSR
jgi:hypothetical protein